MKNFFTANKWYFFLYMLFFIGAMTVVFLTEKGSVVIFFDTHRKKLLDIFFIAVTKIGEYYTYLILILFFVFIRKNYRLATAMAVMGMFLPLISYFLKMYFKHPRPLTYFSKYIGYNDFHGIENLHYHTGHNSFPSGHTFSAFALFTLLALSTKNKSLGILFFLTALMVGISRIYLSQHFVEDVVFGSVLGILYGMLTYYIFFILLKNKNFFAQKS